VSRVNCCLCNSLHRFDGLSEEVKDRLRKTYESLNPVFLKRNIDRHKREIERAYEMKMEKRKREMQKGLGKLSNNLTNLIFCNLQSFSTGYKNNFAYNLNETIK
jgi:hypothetical protein